MKRATTTNHTAITRRAVIGGAGAMAGLLAFPDPALAGERRESSDAFAVLLKGLYGPVTDGPDLGLSTVNLDDGSYSTTKIYPVSGIAGSEDALTAVGDFFVQFGGELCAYDLPGGALSMQFLPQSNTTTFDDGQGGSILQGTWELKVLEGTGIFRRFARGGHNHMLDNLHFLASGDIDEYCICFVTRRHNDE